METPISANCAICFFLSSREAGRSEGCGGGGGGGAAERFQPSLSAADEEDPPETVCRSLSTSFFAFAIRAVVARCRGGCRVRNA